MNLKKNIGLCLLVMAFLASCDNSTKIEISLEEISLLPHPKEISTSPNRVLLSGDSKTYTSNEKLVPLLQLFHSEVAKLTGIQLESTLNNNREADVVFEIDPRLAKEEYHLEIDRNIQLTGGSYQAVAMAKTSLLQLATKQEELLAFPVLTLKDYPDVAYRGLLIDLARSWHSIKSIKQLIDLAAFYKCNYMQLHFTDYQSYTLPSDIYPLLSTPDRSYSKEELLELEAYSQLRGITIVPELEVPGHSSLFAKMYPEIFAIQDVKDNPWIINMGKEEVYETLDLLIGELTEVFKATPLFSHWGR